MDVRGIDNSGIKLRQFESINKEETAASVSEELQEKVQVTEKKEEEGRPLSEKEQQRRLARLQDTLKNHNVEISYNDEVNRFAIKVLDSESKEVVKEIPSEKTLEMFARMLEIEGLLVDEKR